MFVIISLRNWQINSSNYSPVCLPNSLHLWSGLLPYSFFLFWTLTAPKTTVAKSAVFSPLCETVQLLAIAHTVPKMALCPEHIGRLYLTPFSTDGSHWEDMKVNFSLPWKSWGFFGTIHNPECLRCSFLSCALQMKSTGDHSNRTLDLPLKWVWLQSKTFKDNTKLESTVYHE